MVRYTYTSEQSKKRTITTVKEAENVIIATATLRELNRKEILEEPQIRDVANAFSINLEDDLVVMKSENPNDVFYSYYFV